jgi:cytochrome o ubiquinol oxidase subunit IV
MSKHDLNHTFAAGVAPGDHEDSDHATGREVINYVIGLILATVLTIGSFWVASGPSILYTPGLTMALAALAVAQMGVHLAFFLHITTGDDNINNVMALAFGVLIVGIVIAGSLWIMHNMDMNMAMPGSTAVGQPSMGGMEMSH